MIYEIDGLLRVDAGGVIVVEGTGKVSQIRLEEWLRTPIGSVYGLPSWGNPLAKFKHEPIGSEKSYLVEVAIENELIKKLRMDLPSVRLLQVRCESVSEDTLAITFVTPDGEFTTPMPMQKESNGRTS
ncbi:hypothetical protein [Citrobacter sp. NCU1]|uniref:hypothetical protein n=1 Tax=Citrobacter sp. NCU1 TaxID=2026683 RepID=UPI001EE399DA|nr:hypothetical protein [Citrobacter sp. NCU1]